eukprot:g14363.t1
MMKLFFGILALFLVCPFATSQTPTGGGGGGGIPIPPKRAMSAVYQGKCGLDQIGMGLAGKVGTPDEQTKFVNIVIAHVDNIITSCKECKLTAPDIEKFIAPQTKPGRRSLLHLTMTKLDGTGNTGTIKNFFPLPYVSSCDGKFLNDQVQLLATVLCLFSSSTDVACRSDIECDGDVPCILKGMKADAELGYVPLADGTKA